MDYLNVVRKLDRRIEEAIKIIHREIHRNLRVSELARRVHLSTCHFIQLFKAEISLAPKQYIYSCKPEHFTSGRLSPAFAILISGRCPFLKPHIG